MSASANISHPYSPASLQLPHYVPNSKPLNEILGVFFGATLVLAGATFYTSGGKKHLPFLDRLAVTWMAVCAAIHIVIEGYYSWYHASLAGHTTFLGELWKEYSLGDSRYLSSDTCVLTVESVTAVIDGPLCILTVLAFFTQNRYRYLLQMLVSSFQLYGDVIYYITEILENFAHGKKGHPLYFWFYFVFLNSWWLIVPVLLILRSFFKLSSTQALADNQTDRSTSLKKKFK
ncbi:hypothetical protein ScPMuIL_000136 [Solemya velum]